MHQLNEKLGQSFILVNIFIKNVWTDCGSRDRSQITDTVIAIFSKGQNDCPTKIQRLHLRLQKYDIHLTYTPGRFMYTSNTLSRLPIEGHNSTDNEVEIFVDGVS